MATQTLNDDKQFNSQHSSRIPLDVQLGHDRISVSKLRLMAILALHRVLDRSRVCGVPQKIRPLRPIPFLLYTAEPRLQLVKQHSLNRHLFADDGVASEEQKPCYTLSARRRCPCGHNLEPLRS